MSEIKQKDCSHDGPLNSMGWDPISRRSLYMCGKCQMVLRKKNMISIHELEPFYDSDRKEAERE